MKIILDIDDKYAEQVIQAWVEDIEALPLAHLDERKREDKFKDLLTEIIVLKWKNYRTKEVVRQAVASEVKVTEAVITTTFEVIK